MKDLSHFHQNNQKNDFNEAAKNALTNNVYIVLLTKEIPLGSPPHSSNTTNRFPFDFSHERGTWYLGLTITLLEICLNSLMLMQ